MDDLNENEKAADDTLVTAPTEAEDHDLSIDRFYYEINLLQLEGYVFCLDGRAAKRQVVVRAANSTGDWGRRCWAAWRPRPCLRCS